jgi:hypothetical protein
MRIGWIFMMAWISASPHVVLRASMTECVEARETVICYGSEETTGGTDWLIETQDATGRTRRLFERLPFDQEAHFVAVSIQDGWIAYIVHSRWIEDFQMRLETKWELLLFNANGSIRSRVNLPGKPSTMFDALGYVIVRFPDGDIRTYDAFLNGSVGLPPPIQLSLSEAEVLGVAVSWKTPLDEVDAYEGVGHYLVEWTSSDGRMLLPVTVVPQVWGLTDDQTYHAPIRWGSDWPASVDGQRPLSSGTIDVPGSHTFVIEGKNDFRLEWTFRLEASLHGLPLQPVRETVRLYSNATMTLNGQAYAPGTPIVRAGPYELMLTGTGGYEIRHVFVIASDVFGVSNQGVYDAPFVFYVNGTGLLNGRPVSGETRIEAAGSYELAFLEEGVEPKFVTFHVEIDDPHQPKGNLLSIAQIGLAVLGIFGLYFIRKRK